ncbi:MAG: alpha/beta hydrolase [Kofleriaceae bacterium]
MSPRSAAPAPPGTPQPLAIGETFRLDSRVLGEQRVINVYVPPGYGESSDRYTVLYMPDGGIQEDFPHVTGIVDVSIKNQLIRPLIVVGIENTERRRDLPGYTDVPDEREAAPHAGGSERFRQFMRDELKPYIEAHYRTAGPSAIIGESLAGLFVIETLLVEPALFDWYIAVDPSVWWNHKALVRSASTRFASWTAPPKTLFIATADYQDTLDAIDLLLDAHRALAPKDLMIEYEPMPTEHHNSIYPHAALAGIRSLFALAPTRR